MACTNHNCYSRRVDHLRASFKKCGCVLESWNRICSKFKIAALEDLVIMKLGEASNLILKLAESFVIFIL